LPSSTSATPTSSRRSRSGANRATITLAVKSLGRSDPKGIPVGRGRTVGLHPRPPASVFPANRLSHRRFSPDGVMAGAAAASRPPAPRLTQLTLRLDREGRRHVIAESPGSRGATRKRCVRRCPRRRRHLLVASPWTALRACSPGRSRDSLRPRSSTSTRDGHDRARLGGRAAGDVRGAVVWDLYGGIGTPPWSWRSAGHRWSVWTRREGDSSGHDGATRRVRCGFIAGKAEDVLPTLPEPSAVW